MGIFSGTGNGPLSDSPGQFTTLILTRGWSVGTRMKPMSVLQRSGLDSPIDAIRFFEFGWTGQSSITRFHGLFAGRTSRAEQIASASGVSNRIGLSMGGIFALWMRSRRAGSEPVL